MVPAFGVYRQYVGGRSASAAALQALRQEGGPTASLLEELERVGSAELAGGTLPARAVVAEGGRAAAALLGTLLDEPLRRISCYAASMRALLEASCEACPPGEEASAAADECGELVSHLEALLDEQRARDRVSHLARELPPTSLRAALPEGLALPHRRFLREGELRQSEASAEGAAWQRRRAHLFNDILLLVEGGEAPREALGGEGGVASVECIGLAKARGGADGCGRWAEDERAAWVESIKRQIRFLLAAFKQRGKSIAFLPQQVEKLRAELGALHTARRRAEAEVLLLTSEVCALDSQLQAARGRPPSRSRVQPLLTEHLSGQADRRDLSRASFRTRRLSVVAAPGGANGPSAAQVSTLRRRVRRGSDERAQLQCVADGRKTEGDLNDDSLMKEMLFSSS
ncbi:hypothetical protein EMIHUDRAFT_448330 [Emiliania huxleyi CCMP1516]|uniref:Uncharacterized protein n=2 Tax=Emiliania huxleyi TaxID=2903 RepID=A0A0D3IDN6_EMIH1|nr:hypothetical protein EMIHUDRAFT_448330 [Emiliania huxleyi CCMP1516]EOD09371.1 hypothetical protein EMIHUDRAFT_448330 [Emiliania huxleyi CCMP1516]|eukprot:XP_005761800.1 hypothetical protein EMIHUDRAFT_448330 [Emiliania huxleyi CCMP1516]